MTRGKGVYSGIGLVLICAVGVLFNGTCPAAKYRDNPAYRGEVVTQAGATGVIIAIDRDPSFQESR